MDQRAFDDLTKTLASGVSRRTALRQLGAGLAAAVLAGIGVRPAAAAPNECAVYCSRVEPAGPSRAACKQACHKCEGDVRRLCSSPTGWTCCAPGTACRPDGTCATAPASCEGVGCGSSCDNGNPTCACVSTTEDTIACVQKGCTFVSCTSSAECNPGQVCFTEGCCDEGSGGSYCIPLCGMAGTTALTGGFVAAERSDWGDKSLPITLIMVRLTVPYQGPPTCR